jgi:hypothetical protein
MLDALKRYAVCSMYVCMDREGSRSGGMIYKIFLSDTSQSQGMQIQSNPRQASHQ